MITPPQTNVAALGNDKRRNLIPSSVLGMIIFLFCEVMFFAGMISAHMITKANAVGGIWPPPGSPMLPIEETLINTSILLVSGVALFMAHRALRMDHPMFGRWLLASVVLGTLFVALQGREWVALIDAGLTMTSSTHGSFFYFIVGTHGLHALGALGFMVYMITLFRAGELQPPTFWAAEIFWYFVVGLWPLIFWQVYL